MLRIVDLWNVHGFSIAAELHCGRIGQSKGGCSLAELEIGNNADQSRKKVQGVQQH